MAYVTGRSGFFHEPLSCAKPPATAYVGEASTPPVEAEDLFLTVSGSGSTATSLGGVRSSKLGMTVIALLGTKDSPLGQLALDSLVLLRFINEALPMMVNTANKLPAACSNKRFYPP